MVWRLWMPLALSWQQPGRAALLDLRWWTALYSRLRPALPLFNWALTMHPLMANISLFEPHVARCTPVQRPPSSPLQRPGLTHRKGTAVTVDFGPNLRGSCDHWLPARATGSAIKIARSPWRAAASGFFRVVDAKHCIWERLVVADSARWSDRLVGRRGRGGSGPSCHPAYHRRPDSVLVLVAMKT